MQHAVVTVRARGLSPNQTWIRVTHVGLETAAQVIGTRVILHAPRDEVYAGYFGTALLSKVERGEPGFLNIFLDQIRFFETVVPISIDGQTLEGNAKDSTSKKQFTKFSPGLRLLSYATYHSILSLGGAAWQTLIDANTDELAAPDQEPFIDAMTESALHRYRFRQELVRMELKNKLLDRCGAVCCMSGRRLNVPHGPSLLSLSHYWPLGHGGPDNLHNTGLMTCIIHQIWENGLVTMLPDWSLVFAPDIPPLFLAEFNGRTSAQYPQDPTIWPNSRYLDYHRVHIFEKRLMRVSRYAADGAGDL